MEDFTNSIIAQWGTLGILIAFAIYIIYERIKNSLCNDNKEYKNITHDTDIIITQTNAIREELKIIVESINSKIDAIEHLADHKIEVLNKKIINIENSILDQSNKFIDSIEEYNARNVDLHNKRILNQIQIGPILHRIMGNYLGTIDCDHIILGAFHNGTSSLSGIPFCKFDIISEKFSPKRVHYDTEFAPMYKNVDILLHNKLPMILIQNGYVSYTIDEDDENCILSEIDDVLYRRLLGRGIQQIALNILRDTNEIPIGFLCCIKYNKEPMNEAYIKRCALEIENVYNKNV